MVAIEVKPASPPPFFLGNGLGLRKKVLQILGWGDNAKVSGKARCVSVSNRLGILSVAVQSLRMPAVVSG